MKFRLSWWACMAAVLVSVAPACGQAVALRYRWAEGDVVRYRLTEQTSSTASAPGTDASVVDQTMIQDFHISVDDVAADGTATLRHTVDSIRMEIHTPGEIIAFDTASAAKPDPATATVSAPWRAIVGEPITVVMLPTGKIVKLDGMSRIFEKFTSGLPNDPAAAWALDQLKTSFGDEAMGAKYQQAFGRFPDRPVSTGESWTDPMQTIDSLLGALTMTATFTLKSIEGGTGASTAHINVRVANAYGPRAAPPTMATDVMKAADFTTDGEILFDMAKGRMQKAVLKSDTPMTMSIPSGPDGTATAIQIAAKNSMTLEMLER
jgi:Family of unknown function (DUF6263)